MYVFLGLLVILFIFYILDKDKFKQGIKSALKKDWKIFPIFFGALIFSFFLKELFNFINLHSFNTIINILLGTILGFIFPGPRYIIYAFIPEFVNMGFGVGFIVSLIFSQQLLIQPDGTVLQVKYFNWKYSIYFSLLAIGLIFLYTLIFKNLFSINMIFVPFVKEQSFLSYLIETNFNLLPIVFLSVCISGVSEKWISPSFIKKFDSVFIASFLGIITPGPVYEIYPIIGMLHKKGLPIHIITAFLFGQASFGPIRGFLEIKILGLSFVVLRLIVSYIMAITSGYLTLVFNKHYSLFN